MNFILILIDKNNIICYYFWQKEILRMNIYQKVSVMVALMLYVPLSYQILKGVVRQNLATFILWGSLDAVAGLSLLVQGGNYQLPLAYVAGCVVVITSILYSRNVGEWTTFETKITALVLVSLAAWALSGPWTATIFSTTGVVITGLPQLRDSWRNPRESPLLAYAGFTFVNSLNTYAGSAWTVEERLYPFACSVLCGVIVLVSFRSQRLSGAPWYLG